MGEGGGGGGSTVGRELPRAKEGTRKLIKKVCNRNYIFRLSDDFKVLFEYLVLRGSHLAYN